MAKVNEVRIQKIKKLIEGKMLLSALGKYKEYKAASVSLAKIGLEDFDLFKKATADPIYRGQWFPLFSKEGLRLLKIRLLDFFSKKTPEEKRFNELLRLDKLKNKTRKYY
ncbi:MAG: hypothetical protein WCY19_07770 [Candidatus Gastranaerophilaceae bacterium]